MRVLGGSALAVYFVCLAFLGAYGLHRWYLLWLYARHRSRVPPPPGQWRELPRLTVQLPVYNERYVAERLVDAVCALDWPRERLEIQVLDDSTDETSALLARRVERWRGAGLAITHLRRDARTGYKAGALDAALRVATGELVAVFDADFVPRPDFARRLVDHFTDPGVGMVQARWGHLNRDWSALTRVQSIVLDGHFLIEHTARHRSGRFFNFNGTAGIWRRACIEDAGGWEHDTLTEDLDLSYRAQLRGWRFVFVRDHVAPAELPVEMSAFKSQQHRWAVGSIQTARKLLPRVWRARLPFAVKLEATAHMTAYLGYLPMLLLSLVVVPVAFLRSGAGGWTLLRLDLPLFALTTAAWCVFYTLAWREARGTWRAALGWVPFLLAVGIGLSVNNARAVLAGLRGRRTEFRRTPKYALGVGEKPASRGYRGRRGSEAWVEGALALGFAAAMVCALVSGLWGALPFLALFLVGYGYTALGSLAELRARGALGNSA